MADLVINAVDVKQGAGAIRIFKSGIAGEVIVAGEGCYLDTTDNRIKLADADAAVTAAVKGMALNSAEVGQPVDLIEEGEVQVGAAVVVGEVYVVSPTAGKLVAADDALLVSGKFISVVGVGGPSNRMQIGLNASGQAIP